MLSRVHDWCKPRFSVVHISYSFLTLLSCCQTLSCMYLPYLFSGSEKKVVLLGCRSVIPDIGTLTGVVLVTALCLPLLFGLSLVLLRNGDGVEG